MNFPETKRYANGYWDEIFPDLAPKLIPAIRNAPHHVACPVHGGTDSFRFFTDFLRNRHVQ